MDAVRAQATKYNVVVIGDACQAQGAGYVSKKDTVWKKAGSMGLASAFSFDPGKNLGACGEAGSTTTNDEAMAKHVKMLRDHGQAKMYYHDIEDYSGRLDSIQAGWLFVKLPHFTGWIIYRPQHAPRTPYTLQQASAALVFPG